MVTLKRYSLEVLEALPAVSSMLFEKTVGSVIMLGQGDAVDSKLVRWWVWQHFADHALPLPEMKWIRARIPERFRERKNGSSRIVASLHPSMSFLGFADDPRGPDGWADARGHLIVDPDDVASAIGHAVMQRRLTVGGRPIVTTGEQP